MNAAYWSEPTLDVSGLGAFITNVTNFNIGVGTTTQGPGHVLLSNTANTIVTTTLTVGDTGANNGRGTSNLTLGTGTNALQADTINIGRGKSSGPGAVSFVSQTAGSPGTVTITNKAGTGRANINIANVNGVATAGGAVGSLDLRGHLATVTAGTITIGNNNMTSNAGNTSGSLSFDAGTLNVNTLNLAPKAAAGTGTANATVNIGGGSVTVNTTFTLGSQATAGTSIATLNLTAGTLNSTANILDGGGTTTSKITLDGGTLNLNSKTIGGTIPIDTLEFKSGGLQNISQINNGVTGLNKTTTGTLVLAGTNTYTGATTVSQGTLALLGGSLTSPITVNNLASLGFTLGSASTSTSTVNFIAGSTVKITGTPAPATSYTLLTTTSTISGTPVLNASIAGFKLQVEGGNTLKLVPIPVVGYASWQTASGTTQAMDLDHDNDGVANGIEYFLGGSTNTTGFTALPRVTDTAGTLSVTWTKASTFTGSYGTNFWVETSPTLSGVWLTETSGVTVTISGNDVTYTFPAGTSNFARLKVTP